MRIFSDPETGAGPCGKAGTREAFVTILAGLEVRFLGGGRRAQGFPAFARDVLTIRLFSCAVSPSVFSP